MKNGLSWHIRGRNYRWRGWIKYPSQPAGRRSSVQRPGSFEIMAIPPALVRSKSMAPTRHRSFVCTLVPVPLCPASFFSFSFSIPFPWKKFPAFPMNIVCRYSPQSPVSADSRFLIVDYLIIPSPSQITE